MFGGGRGMGGGGSGSMLKVVGRSVARAGVTNLQETLSASSPSNTTTTTTTVSRSTHNNNLNNNNNNNNLSLSGSHFPTCKSPVSANNYHIGSWPSFSSCSSSDEHEWVSIDGNGDEILVGFSDDIVLGSVPSLDEVHSAVSALTQVFNGSSKSQFVGEECGYNVDRVVTDQISSPSGNDRRVSSPELEAAWVEPAPHLWNSRMLYHYGPDRVYDAFHLLQSEPSVQRMVISLSSDKAVWDAVLKNDVVRELRKTYNADVEANNNLPAPDDSDETGSNSNPALNAVKWIFQNTVEKFMEVLKKITGLMNELFRAPDVGNKSNGSADPFEEKLRTSFLLSVVVLLVVVVTRAHRA